MNILVTGATGNTGRRLVQHLVAAGDRPTVLVREHGRVGLLGRNAALVSPVIGDYGDPISLDAAMQDVDRVFLVCPNSPAQVDQEIAVIDAAVRAGVSRIVKVSAHGADPESSVAFWRWHAAIEQHLAASGIPSVALRPTFSMANILGHADGVLSDGVVFAPAVHTPIAMTDPDDIAELAARLLTADELPITGAVEVTGPAGVTFDDLAAILARLLARPVHYVPGTADQVTGYLTAHGTPPFVVDQILAIFATLQAGGQAQPLPTVERLLGRAPRSLDRFLAEHVGAFRMAS